MRANSFAAVTFRYDRMAQHGNMIGNEPTAVYNLFINLVTAELIKSNEAQVCLSI